MQYERCWPPPLWHVVEYIAYMSLNNYATKTVNCHLAAISYYNKVNGYLDVTQSFIVKQMLSGLHRVQFHKDNRLPITITLLHKLLPNLKHVCSSQYEACLFSVAYTLAFSALLRVSEITLTNKTDKCKALQFKDIQATATDVKLFLRSSKNDQNSIGAEISIPISYRNRFLYDALQDYLTCRPKIDGLFLCHFDGSPVTSYQFNNILKKVLVFSGVGTTFYKSHSFRIGGATYLHSIGKTDEEIKLLGRWKSNAYKNYIRLNIPDFCI